MTYDPAALFGALAERGIEYLLGIDPDGVVHIADRLLREIDGPMLRTGLQGFHGGQIAFPWKREDRPDPHRLELRYERFTRTVA